MQVHQRFGNQAVQKMLQAKLAISQPQQTRGSMIQRSLADVFNSYRGSCDCGEALENNCAHYLGDALLHKELKTTQLGKFRTITLGKKTSHLQEGKRYGASTAKSNQSKGAFTGNAFCCDAC